MNYLETSKDQEDLVHPGEQWFFYWKTSAALWEGKILERPLEEVIFIPIYWGFHAESPGKWDFGQIHPERDLLRLTNLMTQHKRKFCWLLPLTPAPFLPNGGVPAHTARTLSISIDGVHLAAIDQEQKLNKMFSFFEPKVWEAFGQFLNSFAQFLTINKIKSPVWGAEFSYVEGSKIISYLTDRSLAFEQGFSRYLKQNFPQGTDLSEIHQEEQLKSNFLDDVFKLFKTTAESSLAPFWMGMQSICLLGGGPKDTIQRSLKENKTQLDFFRDLFFVNSESLWPSSALMMKEEKKNLFVEFLREHFSSRAIDERYNYSIHSKFLGEEFRPFSLIDIFGSNHCGLINYLDTYFRWLYQVHGELNFTTEWIENNQYKIKFFHSRSLNRTSFSQMLKLFLMGEKVILDKTQLHPELEKRLQIFILENNLKIQSINFLTPVSIVELGEGRLITYEGDKFKNKEEQNKFWEHLFRYLNLAHPLIKLDQDVFSLWRIRATSPFELNYLDVRRVNLYNPTSYKKNVYIQTQKHFAFMKMIDPLKAQAKSTPHGVEVELLPQGRIALDFGHYEES
ncbi:MAG: hypothetical protein AB7I27_13120 [Bacteriovoracaceae bacterium]